MTYDYHCKACNSNFELNIASEDRDKPIKKKCPLCQKKGKITREFIKAPLLSYEGAVSDIRRAGSGWNDVLGRVAQYAGPRSQVDRY